MEADVNQNGPSTAAVGGLFGVRAAVLAAGALVLFLIGGLILIARFADEEKARDLATWQVRIGIIAEGRASALADWVERQFNVVRGLTENPSLQIYLTELTLASGDASQVTDEPAQIGYLRNLLVVTAQQGGFLPSAAPAQVASNARVPGTAGIALFDATKKPLVATADMPALEGRLAEFMRGAIQAQRAMLDLYLGHDGTPTIAFLMPIFGVQGGRTAADQTGWALAVRPAAPDLFNQLRRPGSRESGVETLLLRSAGGTIEFLSPLADGTPPLQRQLDDKTPDLAEAFAVGKPGGFGVKRDYRGIEVVVTGRAVAGTPWTVAHKVDRDLALGESDQRRTRLVAFLTLGLAVIGAVLAAVWRHASSRRATKAAADFAALARRFENQGTLLRLVTDNQPNAIFIADAEGRYRFANQETVRRTGVAESDLLGKRLDAVLGPAAAARHLKLNAEALAKGETQRGIERIEDRGALAVLQSAHIPLPPGTDATRNVLVVEQDVTSLTLERERRERTLQQLVRTLTAACDRRDHFAAHQSARCAALARAVAVEMGLDPVLADTTEIAGNLLNFGKILVPTELLTKAARLTNDEIQQIRGSIQATADIISGVEFDGPVVETLRQVQERWDGSGPRGLRGEAILVTARIVAVANAFVALASPRAYRAGNDVDTVLSELLAQVGTHFERRVVAALVSHFDNRGGRAKWEDPAWLEQPTAGAAE